MNSNINVIGGTSHFITDIVIFFSFSCFRLLRRKELPCLVDCFATADIERGLSVRPSCRFEIFKQDIDVDIDVVSVEHEHLNKFETEVQNGNGSSIVNKKFKKIQVEVVLDIAHNQDAMIALVSKFKGIYPNRILR